jgi:1-acyl-sn-glycerol-3-phosphate acyltransferase
MTQGNAPGAIRYWLGRLLLAVLGWRTTGRAPAHAKYVLVAAPHTSNWDLPLFLACSYVMGVRVRWTGKKNLFRPPLGWLLRWLGGFPVDRRASRDLVQQLVDELGRQDHLVLAIQPEGTRRRAEYWRTGFYYIALGAQVPIALTYLDYSRKEGGFGPCLIPSGDLERDAETMRAFYDDKVGRYPENFTPVAFPPSHRDQAVARTGTGP